MYKQILALHLMCRDRQIPHTLATAWGLILERYGI